MGRWNRRNCALVRITALPFPLLWRGKMRAPAIEAVMGGHAGFGTAAARAGADRQGIPPRAIMPRETCPRLLRDTGALLRKRKLIHPYTDGFGIGTVDHGGAL